MNRTVTVFYALASPWAYLAWQRFQDLCAASGTHADYRLIKVAEVFKVSGGLPLGQRAPQRQAYRLMELRRWRDHLGVPLNLKPRFFPVDEQRAARMVIAHGRAGGDVATLSHAMLRAVWIEERDIADPATLTLIATEQGLDGAALQQSADSTVVGDAYQANTDQAIATGVFGVPTFAVGDELFWGQDRLDFLARALHA